MKFFKEKGPHIKDGDTTSKIMTRLLIALAPIVAFVIFKNSLLVYYYTDASVMESVYPILIILVSIFTSFISEFLYFKLIQKKSLHESIYEINRSFTIIPGLLLVLVLPPNIPLWLVCFGSMCASIFGKMIYGGFGQNIFNPALIGYLFISASYSSKMGSYLNLYELDTISTATPLTNLSSLNYYGSYESIVGNFGTLLNFFSGMIPGALGETCKLLIIIAFIYLALTKTIKYLIPIMYVLTVFIMTYFIGNIAGLDIWYPLFHILSGGLLFGAVFMATDPVTSPSSKIGQIFYGISLGILTVILRFKTSYPEGVMTSILFMNMLVPLFDKLGVYFKYNIKRIWIIILIFVSVITLLIFNIGSSVNSSKEGSNKVEASDKVKILEKTTDGNKIIYSVTSKGWGLVKATVEVVDNEIKSIIVTDSSGETQWSEIEKNNYIYEAIINQDNIDDLDAVSGSTISSNAIKNIIRKILSEVENEG